MTTGTRRNIHGLVDELAVAAFNRFFVRGRKFFRESSESLGFEEHLHGVELELPEFGGEGYFEVKARSRAVDLDPAFRVAQWKGTGHPTVIYHHGMFEQPFDGGFDQVFPLKKIAVPANLIVLRAPFNQSHRQFLAAVREASNVTVMFAAFIKLTEGLLARLREADNRRIIVTGLSMGGFVTNLHRAYFNTADAYIPMLAGTGRAESSRQRLSASRRSPFARP
ncbi:MAG: alpha/beta hydrolase family protein [Candidatus Desulforudis sp.]|nr:alpha/beta hydrolase family protein [Desulforudis sp.]